MSLVITLLFATHLLCVNVASAGPLVAAWFDWLEGRGSTLAGQTGRYLAWWAVALLVPGGALGIAVGALYWDDAYRQVLARLTSKFHFGVWEVLFSLVLMLAQALWWRARPQARTGERVTRILVALLASTNLLYHFPMLFAVIEHTVASGEATREPIASSVFREVAFQPAILSRALHFVLAAVAMCGVMLLGFALRLRRRGADEEDVQRVAAWGGQIALVPSLVQIPVGLWLTASLSRPLQSAVTGNDTLATVLLLASIGLALWMMQTLAAIAIGDSQRSQLIKAMALMVVVITLMSGTLHRLRTLGVQSSAATTLVP